MSPGEDRKQQSGVLSLSCMCKNLWGCSVGFRVTPAD